MLSLEQRYLHIKHTISKGRETQVRAKQVTLVAVSKTQPVEVIEPVIQLGQRVFGENRVQEGLEKWPALLSRYPDIELHLIGPLQTNKVKDALTLFDVIETVDREKLAKKLAHELEDHSSPITCFIQVNVGEEPQKSGILPSEANDFIQYCLFDLALPITGLMCIPPAHEASNGYFSQLRSLADLHSLPHLSMGMSHDYVDAIRLGASHVRVGTALFGSRHPI